MPHQTNQTLYTEVVFTGVTPEQAELLTATLSGAGFDSFAEEEGAFSAYILSNGYDEKEVQKILDRIPGMKRVSFTSRPLEEKNWNAEWESNYPPVLVDGICLVRAPFHEPVPGMPYDLCIMPKMSFGTAHHETTSQVISWMLQMDFSGKRVMDMGTGTGVLAILAEKMGAAEVVAIDNDSWSFENAKENTEKNNCSRISVILGDEKQVPAGPFDIILANINRNILLQQIHVYADVLRKGGTLVMSGFYAEDLQVIRNEAARNGMELEGSGAKNRWIVAKFIR